MGGDFSSKGKQDCSKGIYVLAGYVSLMKAAVIHSVPKKEDTRLTAISPSDLNPIFKIPSLAYSSVNSQ